MMGGAAGGWVGGGADVKLAVVALFWCVITLAVSFRYWRYRWAILLAAMIVFLVGGMVAVNYGVL